MPRDPDQPELGQKRFSRGGFLTAGDADDAMQDAIKKRQNQDRFGAPVPTIGDYADQWIVGLKLADSTIRGYAKELRDHIKPQLGDIRLDRLTATRIARHYRELERDLSPNTVSKVHVLLGQILDAAIEDGHITVNQAKKKRTVRPPTSKEIRAAKPEIVTWTGEQLNTFLDWNRNELDDEDFPLWRVSRTPGCGAVRHSRCAGATSTPRACGSRSAVRRTPSTGPRPRARRPAVPESSTSIRTPSTSSPLTRRSAPRSRSLWQRLTRSCSATTTAACDRQTLSLTDGRGG